MATEVRIGTAYLDFSGRNAQFRLASRQNITALQRQRRAVGRLNDRIRRFNMVATAMRRRLLSVRSAVGLLAGGGGIGLLITRATDLGATLVETSARTGLTVERLQLLQRAFQGDGAEIENVNRSLSFLLRSFSEAAQGTAEYADEFRALGIDAAAFAATGEDQYQLILRIADGMLALESQADRARVAQALFGRTGQDLLNVLQRGGADLEAVQEAMRRLGIVADDAAPRLKALQQTFTDVGNAAETGLANAVAENADELRAFAENLTTTLPAAINRLADLLRGLRDNIPLFTAGLAAFGASAVIGGITRAVRVIRDLRLALAGVSALSAASAVSLRSLAGVAQVVGSAAVGLGVYRSIIAEFERSDAAVAAAVGGAAGGGLLGTGGPQQRITPERLAAIVAAEQRSRLGSFSFGATAFGGNPFDQPAIGPDFIEQAARVNNEILRSQPAYIEWAENINRIQTAFGATGSAIADFGADFLVNLDDIGGTFRRFVDRLISDLSRILLFQPIANAITSSLSNQFLGSSFQDNPAFAQLFNATLQGRAQGGGVSSGQSYMVGERGRPELFRPTTSGTITPLPNGAGAGVTIAPVLNLRVNDAAGARGAGDMLLREATTMIRRVIADELGRRTPGRSAARIR